MVGDQIKVTWSASEAEDFGLYKVYLTSTKIESVTGLERVGTVINQSELEFLTYLGAELDPAEIYVAVVAEDYYGNSDPLIISMGGPISAEGPDLGHDTDGTQLQASLQEDLTQYSMEIGAIAGLLLIFLFALLRKKGRKGEDGNESAWQNDDGTEVHDLTNTAWDAYPEDAEYWDPQ